MAGRNKELEHGTIHVYILNIHRHKARVNKQISKTHIGVGFNSGNEELGVKIKDEEKK